MLELRPSTTHPPTHSLTTSSTQVYEHVITCDSAQTKQVPIERPNRRRAEYRGVANGDAAAEEDEEEEEAEMDWKYMPEALQAMYNHADYTIETYCAGNAVELHFEATLYLLARHSNVPLTDTQLLAAVADATKVFFAKRWAEVGGDRRRIISPSPLGPV